MPTVTRTTWLYQSASKSLHRLTLLAMECAPKLHFLILWASRSGRERVGAVTPSGDAVPRSCEPDASSPQSHYSPLSSPETERHEPRRRRRTFAHPAARTPTNQSRPAGITGLGRAAISSRLEALLELGLVVPVSDAASTGGRPAAPHTRLWLSRTCRDRFSWKPLNDLRFPADRKLSWTALFEHVKAPNNGHHRCRHRPTPKSPPWTRYGHCPYPFGRTNTR